MKQRLTDAVMTCVLERGQCDADAVVKACGHLVSAALAARWGHKSVARHRKQKGAATPPPAGTVLVRRGRREAVLSILRYLTGSGRIRRISRGVYAPSLPKAFRPQAG